MVNYEYSRKFIGDYNYEIKTTSLMIFLFKDMDTNVKYSHLSNKLTDFEKFHPPKKPALHVY